MADDQQQDPTFVRITNAMVWAKLNEIEQKLEPLRDYQETKKRVSRLEFRFYGVLAGIISTFGVIIYIKVGV